jgi:hypothetical protein
MTAYAKNAENQRLLGSAFSALSAVSAFSAVSAVSASQKMYLNANWKFRCGSTPP